MNKRPQPTHHAWLMLFLAFLTSFTMHLLLFSYSSIKESIILEMHLTYAEAGLIFSISVFALVLLRIPWGILMDRIEVKWATGLALTLLGVFGVLRSFAVNYETLLLFQLFLGVGFAAVMPCLPKLVASWFPPERTGFAMGVAISGFAIGDIVGLSGTPYLLMLLGNWRQVFLVYGLWAFMLIVFWWILSRGSDQDRELSLAHYAQNNPVTLKAFVGLLKVKQLWLLTGLYLCAGAIYDTLLIWLPSLLESEGVSQITAGLLTSMLPLGFLIASFAIGIMSDKAGLRKPFILVLGLFSGPVIFAVGTFPPSSVWFVAFVTGLCTVGILTLVLTIPVELQETKASVASAVGLITSAGNLGSFIIPPVVGQIRDITGSFLWAVLLLALLGELIFVLGLPIAETGRKGKGKFITSEPRHALGRSPSSASHA